jgi:NhaA family Na+:H+ antiporter
VLGIGAVILLARIGVRSITVYALLGVGVWLGFHESGVHATIAGVILGLLTPAQPSIGKGLLAETLSPLERLETALHPWVSFGILPLFAFANAGVPVRAGAFANPVAIAVILGLMLGKPIGITLFSWLAVRTGLSRRPADISWGVLAAGGVLAGIGFTMSLFITGLALEESLQDAAKVGILSASTLCAAIGTALLLWLLPRPSQSR